MKILFIGATGMLGKPVATRLASSGFDTTLLARDVAKTQLLFPFARIVAGDLFNKDSLVKAFAGQDAVYMSLSVEQHSGEKDPQPEREGIDNIIAAAKQCGIRRLMYLSSLVHFYNGMNGFDWWAFTIKQSAVDKLKASGIAYTVFYSSTFMETFPYQMMHGSRLVLLGRSIAPMWFIAAKDYANQVAQAVEIAGTENREFTIQGLEPFTFDEAAAVFIASYKKEKLKVLRAPVGLIKFFGHFNQPFNYGWRICEALNKYPEKFDSEKTWAELGRPTITLAEYAAALTK